VCVCVCVYIYIYIYIYIYKDIHGDREPNKCILLNFNKYEFRNLAPCSRVLIIS
jgi:hypothetical protein